MTARLQVTVGQCSDAGRKPLNQDFHAAMIPREPLLGTKGIAVALADGISSSAVSQVASELAVKGFLEDYYATSEAWSVKTSVQRVLQATNSWLYAQTRNGPYRYQLERGYVCTFSALVLKSTTAHLFHVGDARIYRLAGGVLEQLTEDHRLWVSREESYLSRALGMSDRLEIDYHRLGIEPGETFVLATDGVHEHLDGRSLAGLIADVDGDLDRAARRILEEALARGSDDNLTIQLVRIEQLPPPQIEELHGSAAVLAFPPELRPRMDFDGYRILRELHHSSRSHLYLALEPGTDRRLVLKTPSVDLRDDAAYRERLLMEEWAARRVDSVHLVRPCGRADRGYLYSVSEFIEGQTLAQWMTDHPRPGLEPVRGIVEQLARGLYALHRQEMLHQDLRPSNVMIDSGGTVKIIDLGSVRVAGVAETGGLCGQPHILGTAQYTAPEYFLGEAGTQRSDLFSLGVIVYQMLSGRLPYGPGVARATTRAAQRRLAYRSVREGREEIPVWIDEALRKAVQVDPHRRYDTLSEFVHDLRQPNPAFLRKARPPLLERDPVVFWQGVSLLLAVALAALLALGARGFTADPGGEGHGPRATGPGVGNA